MNPSELRYSSQSRWVSLELYVTKFDTNDLSFYIISNIFAVISTYQVVQ